MASKPIPVFLPHLLPPPPPIPPASASWGAAPLSRERAMAVATWPNRRLPRWFCRPMVAMQVAVVFIPAGVWRRAGRRRGWGKGLGVLEPRLWQ
jgi:hypothetical protein